MQGALLVVCWASGISAVDRKRLERLVRKASLVMGCPLDSAEMVGERRMKNMEIVASREER